MCQKEANWNLQRESLADSLTAGLGMVLRATRLVMATTRSTHCGDEGDDQEGWD